MEIKTVHCEYDGTGKLRAVSVDRERFPGTLDDTSNQLPEAAEALRYLAGQGFEVAHDQQAGRRVTFTLRRTDATPKNAYERLQAWARGEAVAEPENKPAPVVPGRLTNL